MTSRRHFEIKWLSFLDSLQNFLQDTFQEIFTYTEKMAKYAKNVILGDFPIFLYKYAVH